MGGGYKARFGPEGKVNPGRLAAGVCGGGVRGSLSYQALSRRRAGFSAGAGKKLPAPPPVMP